MFRSDVLNGSSCQGQTFSARLTGIAERHKLSRRRLAAFNLKGCLERTFGKTFI